MISENGVDDVVADLTFKARALAQAHPLSAIGDAYRRQVIAVERSEQPLTEFADWAATAFLVGYCLRRVEEAETDSIPTPDPTVCGDLDLDDLRARADGFADEIRNGRAPGKVLLDPPLVEALLDRIISTEIDKRTDHWKDNVCAEDWADFERYVTWWVIHGYAVRAAEHTDPSAP